MRLQALTVTTIKTGNMSDLDHLEKASEYLRSFLAHYYTAVVGEETIIRWCMKAELIAKSKNEDPDLELDHVVDNLKFCPITKRNDLGERAPKICLKFTRARLCKR